MPKLTIPMAATLLASALLAACDDKSDDTSGASDDDLMAADLWTEIGGYTSWDQVDPWIGVQESADGTHGPYVQIWLNSVASDAIAAGGGGEMPDGAILVKEGHTAEDAEASAVTVMKKVAGYDSANGDWFWAKYSTTGDVDTAGAETSCSGCHTSGQDYVRFTTW